MILNAERHRLIDADVTLDDRPASISGAHNDFATIRDRATGLSAEWSWETVKRVVDQRAGRFYT